MNRSSERSNNPKAKPQASPSNPKPMETGRKGAMPKGPSAAGGAQEGAPVGTGTPLGHDRLSPSSGQAGAKKG